MDDGIGLKCADSLFEACSIGDVDLLDGDVREVSEELMVGVAHQEMNGGGGMDEPEVPDNVIAEGA